MAENYSIGECKECGQHIIVQPQRLIDDKQAASKVESNLMLQADKLIKYLRCKGMRCPECGSEDILPRRMHTADGTIGEDIECQYCLAAWRDEYKLVTVTAFKTYRDRFGADPFSKSVKSTDGCNCCRLEE